MEITNASYISEIGDQTGIGGARRTALELAASQGFDETAAGKLAIAVTEASANVLKHAQRGQILLRAVGAGIEMIAIDKGAGIANVEDALIDGRSSAGTAGIGLGAIARLASFFDIYTSESGTALLAHIFPSEQRRQLDRSEPSTLEIGAVQSVYPGETMCGDGWAQRRSRLFMVDGLGHGFHAARAAGTAIESFEHNWLRPGREIIESVHLALRSTRGAAVATLELDSEKGVAQFCGVGNIAGTVIAGETRRGMMSHNGTAGHEVHQIAALDYPWPPGALLIMHTDGISSKWDLNAYEGLAERHPGLIAAVLYRDFRRQRDDATVVVVRACRNAFEGGRS
ncbi:MAG TPA: ATP-binding protein [Bryobacteraceae bacterium]|nr:ATP-binding protein [Bryobacteraceae bacterium]